MEEQADYRRGDIDLKDEVGTLGRAYQDEINDLERANIILKADINVLELNIVKLENTKDVLEGLIFRLMK